MDRPAATDGPPTLDQHLSAGVATNRGNIQGRSKNNPALDLLLPETMLEQPLWRSLIQNLGEFLFPKKLPPVVLTTKPLPVKDIWGFYDYRRKAVLGSTVMHIAVLAAIIGLTMLSRKLVRHIVKPQATVVLVSPACIYVSPSSREKAGGGVVEAIATNCRLLRANRPNLPCNRSFRRP